MFNASSAPFKKSLQEANFLSILCDGATDVSMKEQEACYVRFCVKGDIAVKFLSLETTATPNAANILNAIETSVQKYGGLHLENFYSKLVGFGSDGASVMLGKKGGVASLMREKKPELQAIHCYAHRLELAYKQVVTCSTYYQKIGTLVSSLHTMYHKSSTLRTELEGLYRQRGPSCQVPTRAGRVRWIPFMIQAVGICFRNCESI